MNSLLVNMCYKDVKLKSDKPDEKNFRASCRYCINKTVSGNINSSTNFLDHIRVSTIQLQLIKVI